MNRPYGPEWILSTVRLCSAGEVGNARFLCHSSRAGRERISADALAVLVWRNAGLNALSNDCLMFPVAPVLHPPASTCRETSRARPTSETATRPNTGCVQNNDRNLVLTLRGPELIAPELFLRLDAEAPARFARCLNEILHHRSLPMRVTAGSVVVQKEKSKALLSGTASDGAC